jgi:F5/8 type C domain
MPNCRVAVALLCRDLGVGFQESRIKQILVAGVIFSVLGCTSAQAQDLALNQPASASSTEGNRTDLRPALANDGNSSSRWSSNYANNQWWQVDLGSVREINRVELNWETAYASRYRIRTRTPPGNGWSTAATVTISSLGLKVHTFPARNARYVRIVGDQRATPWGISLWDVRVFGPTSSPPPPDGDGDGVPDSTDQCPTQPGPASNGGCPSPPPPPPPPPPGTVTLQEVDGGPSYFARFSNPLPTNPGYFPIASWCRPVHDQGQVNQYLDFGLNTIICLENPELTNEALLRQNGLKAIVQSNERTRFNDIGSETAGWNIGDEFDMRQNGENLCPSVLDSALAGVPNDSRLIHVNYGKGVGTWSERGFGQWTDQKAACYVNYPALDIVSIDTYWFTDVNEGSLPQGRHGWGYGNDIARLRYLDGFDGQRKPVFAWTELGPAGYGERRTILPDEVRSAVWHQIIAGARMVAYFDHNFGQSTEPGAEPTCHGSTIRGECYPRVRAAAKAVNQQIRDLAPVLNSPFVTAGHSISGAPTRRMVKWYAAGGRFYVFLATENGGSATFSMPCVGDATAVRLAPSNLPGEAASIPVRGGSFSDSFADKNAVHIYRIDGGSTCGLAAG